MTLYELLLGNSSTTNPDCSCITSSDYETTVGQPAQPDCSRLPFQPWQPTIAQQTLYQTVPELFQTPLYADWHLYCNPLAGGAPCVLNQAAHERLQTFRQARMLNNALDEQLAQQYLIQPHNHQKLPRDDSIDQLTAWFHVTNACNLECPYCYVRKSSAKMSFEIGKKAMDALFHTAKLRNIQKIQIKYAGGEATLHYRMVMQLHEYAQELAQSNRITIDAVVLSNGTIMPPPFAQWIAESSVRLMISVDGIGDDHDQQRPWRGQQRSAFAAIEHHLEQQLMPHGIRPDVSITITGKTADRTVHAVAWAIDHNLPFSLNFYRENEQSVRFSDLRFEEEQIIAGMLNAYQLIEERLPEYPFLDGLLDRVQAQTHQHTCGVGNNYLVFTHDGNLAQCQMHLEDSQPFHARSDLIPLIASGAIQNVSVEQKVGCRECQWRYRCSGGCPIVTFRATGRFDVQSPNCTIYRTLYPAALRLEGLRILKVNGY